MLLVYASTWAPVCLRGTTRVNDPKLLNTKLNRPHGQHSHEVWMTAMGATLSKCAGANRGKSSMRGDVNV